MSAYDGMRVEPSSWAIGSVTPIFTTASDRVRVVDVLDAAEAYASRRRDCAGNRHRRARTMPPFEKSPPELVDRFDAVAGRFPTAERRKMFGYPALFVGGNLVTGLF